MTLDEISTRPADYEDLDRLRTLAEQSPGAPKWTADTWRQVLDSASGGVQRVVLVAEQANELVGFGVLGRAGNEAEIESLAVRRSSRRRGVGTRLCSELLAWARSHGATHGFLEVRVSNASARRLYTSLGFREAGVRRDYYRDPDEDALVMTMDL